MKSSESAIITPFNAFSFFSFILLAGVAILVHNTKIGTFGLAAFSAAFGYVLIGGFLIWTLTEGD